MKSFDVIAETRRKWSDDERRQIVEETLAQPVSVVARKHRVAVSLLFRWRHQAGLPGKKVGAKHGQGPSGTVPAALPVPSFTPVNIEAPARPTEAHAVRQILRED